jgi:hypothetical protein
MAELIQEGAKFDISMRLDNDLSFDVTVGFDLTLFDYYGFIVPMTSGSPEISVEITPVDLTIGKLHFFISKTSIKDLPIVKNKHRYYFNINTPKQEVPAISVFTRTILQGYFNVTGN